MQIVCAHQYTHAASGVSLGELYQIALYRKQNIVNLKNVNNNVNEYIYVADFIPVIEFDNSWVYHSSSISIDQRLNLLIDLALEFSKTGFHVYCICDGNIRHHSKRVSVKPKGKYLKLIVDVYLKKAELMKVPEQRLQRTSQNEINIILIEEEKVSN